MARKRIIRVRFSDAEYAIVFKRAGQIYEDHDISKYIRDLTLYEADNRNIPFRPGIINPELPK